MRLCDWPYEIKVITVCDLFFGKPICIVCCLYGCNQPLAEPGSI